MWKTIVYVAIGSAFGGVARYLMQQYIQKRVESTFPYGTLGVNLLGCFVIGIVVGLADKGNVLSPQGRIFLAVGICGGFTTFSSFVNENYSMLRGGELLNTFVYIAVSVIVGLVATALGILLIKNL
ncbi:MAG TPA: fluoride efflux transporter CrcB [Mucilaginibacter sp.]|jgi:CrcB protein|nr:fluoride efflux transporter CrcB [Mucilaginibacter sp.]